MLKLYPIGFPVILALFLVSGCSNTTPPKTELVVYAASSLTEAFQEIAKNFEVENPKVQIILNFNGSQRLSAQLINGARADLFASANWVQMDAVVDSGLVQGNPTNFASNNLVAIASVKSTENPTLEYLAHPGTKVVLAQDNVPVGHYSREALQNLESDTDLGSGYAQRVLANLVSGESNVRNVAQKVALGEADAGIVYRTDARSPDIKDLVVVIPIPESMNVIADYPVAIMQESHQKILAQKFIEFILSEDGQSTLERFGFGRAQLTNSAELPSPAQAEPGR